MFENAMAFFVRNATYYYIHSRFGYTLFTLFIYEPLCMCSLNVEFQIYEPKCNVQSLMGFRIQFREW